MTHLTDISVAQQNVSFKIPTKQIAAVIKFKTNQNIV